MVLGLSLETFTLVHVIISLVAIVAGVAVAAGMLKNQRLDGLTSVFLWTTLATTATGFLFPFHGMTPAIALGILTLPVLLLAAYARGGARLKGSWRWIYVLTAILALYLNVFVLVVQAFLKIPALHALAPKGNEPPFAITQFLVLVVFVVWGIAAAKRFRPEAAMAAAR